MRYKIMKQLTVQARTKGSSQMRNRRNGHVSSDEGTCRRDRRASASAQMHQEGNSDSFPLRWIVVKKTKQILGFEESR